MNLIKKIKENKKINKLRERITVLTGGIASAFILFTTQVYADSGTSSIDSFITFACDWLVKIGGVIALVGGVMFALGWQREDAERKIKRLNDIDGRFYASCDCAVKELVWTIKTKEELINWIL